MRWRSIQLYLHHICLQHVYKIRKTVESCIKINLNENKSTTESVVIFACGIKKSPLFGSSVVFVPANRWSIQRFPTTSHQNGCRLIVFLLYLIKALQTFQCCLFFVLFFSFSNFIFLPPSAEIRTCVWIKGNIWSFIRTE